ncbi:MAG: hypothetical protein D6806_15020 [Deltaproteobacteria bacterium]|nr:MAG: hypothetical protein D6806_15020 [Deltaproteobacteria bacterium]
MALTALTVWLLAPVFPAAALGYVDPAKLERLTSRRGSGWDVQLELGYVPWGQPSFSPAMWGRLRVGWLLVDEPWYAAAGGVFTTGGLGHWAGGGQVELTHVGNAFWVQFSLEGASGVGLQAGFGTGWNLFGVEFAYSPLEIAHWLVVCKIRVPIGIAVFGLTH